MHLPISDSQLRVDLQLGLSLDFLCGNRHLMNDISLGIGIVNFLLQHFELFIEGVAFDIYFIQTS